MACQLDSDLWKYNFVKVVLVDSSDDYVLMREPMPCQCYPVLHETWVPSYKLGERLPELALVDGFLYDWHESKHSGGSEWFVGMVRAELAS
ncbi:MAG: hypothetical protein JST40_12400 [Armatimonadetes bacterium]|nr:hypothetical protein [Armatimonadota bacterium]